MARQSAPGARHVARRPGAGRASAPVRRLLLLEPGVVIVIVRLVTPAPGIVFRRLVRQHASGTAACASERREVSLARFLAGPSPVDSSGSGSAAVRLRRRRSRRPRPAPVLFRSCVAWMSPSALMPPASLLPVLSVVPVGSCRGQPRPAQCPGPRSLASAARNLLIPAWIRLASGAAPARRLVNCAGARCRHRRTRAMSAAGWTRQASPTQGSRQSDRRRPRGR